jgi:hypothetical protein
LRRFRNLKREVLAKLLQIASNMDHGAISDEEILASADELFVAYDREEQSE